MLRVNRRESARGEARRSGDEGVHWVFASDGSSCRHSLAGFWRCGFDLRGPRSSKHQKQGVRPLHAEVDDTLRAKEPRAILAAGSVGDRDLRRRPDLGNPGRSSTLATRRQTTPSASHPASARISRMEVRAAPEPNPSSTFDPHGFFSTRKSTHPNEEDHSCPPAHLQL